MGFDFEFEKEESSSLVGFAHQPYFVGEARGLRGFRDKYVRSCYARVGWWRQRPCDIRREGARDMLGTCQTNTEVSRLGAHPCAACWDMSCRTALHTSCRSLLACRQPSDKAVIRRLLSCCVLLNPSFKQVCGLAACAVGQLPWAGGHVFGTQFGPQVVFQKRAWGRRR
jgi:hypothetical protein